MNNIQLGEKSERVVQLQKDLLKLGYDLPKYGADGIYGFETAAAVLDFVSDHNGAMAREFEEECLPLHTVERIRRMALSAMLPPTPSEIMVADLTEHHARKNQKGTRPWSAITGIVLHQTGIDLADNRERWEKLRAHIGIPSTDDPRVYLVYPFTSYLWHANKLNRFTVGIEISGCFAGLEDDPETRIREDIASTWKGGLGKDGKPDVLRESQIVAAREAIKIICSQVSAHGGMVTHLYAHRQSSGTRRSDPGEAIWHSVGVWGREELGLITDLDYTIGSGRSIPKEWDPKATARY